MHEEDNSALLKEILILVFTFYSLTFSQPFPSKYIYLNKPITVLFFNEVKERTSYLKMRLKAYVMDIRYELILKAI